MLRIDNQRARSREAEPGSDRGFKKPARQSGSKAKPASRFITGSGRFCAGKQLLQARASVARLGGEGAKLLRVRAVLAESFVTNAAIAAFSIRSCPVTHLTDPTGHSSYRYWLYLRFPTTERHSYYVYRRRLRDFPRADPRTGHPHHERRRGCRPHPLGRPDWHERIHRLRLSQGSADGAGPQDLRCQPARTEVPGQHLHRRLDRARARRRKRINAGEMEYMDIHLSHVAQFVEYGFLGKLDLALIEVTAVLEDGRLVPSSSLGNNKTWIEQAEHVIIEVNSWQPEALEGMHDIYYGLKPPDRKSTRLN